MHKSMNSMPLLRNLAIFCSVPASKTALVITLWAERLYSGTMTRLELAVEDNEETEPIEEVEEYREPASERDAIEAISEVASESCSGLTPVKSTERLLACLLLPVVVVAGGMSWSWRLSGWFDLAGGGLTTIKVYWDCQPLAGLFIELDADLVLDLGWLFSPSTRLCPSCGCPHWHWLFAGLVGRAVVL